VVKLRHVRYPYTDGSIECAASLIIRSNEIRTVAGWQQVQALIAGWCIPKYSPGLRQRQLPRNGNVRSAYRRTTLLPRTLHECEMDCSQDPMQFCFGIAA
jgi:hypothetical protein